MVVAKINFPNFVKNNKERENDYLEVLINCSLSVLDLYKKANNRSYRIKKQRLRLIQQGILEYFNVDVDIFKLIDFIIKNLRYSDDKKFIMLDDNIRYYNVKLETLAKFIAVGSVGNTRSTFFKECFELANSIATVNLFTARWGVL